MGSLRARFPTGEKGRAGVYVAPAIHSGSPDKGGGPGTQAAPLQLRARPQGRRLGPALCPRTGQREAQTQPVLSQHRHVPSQSPGAALRRGVPWATLQAQARAANNASRCVP